MLDADPAKQNAYDMREVIARVVDRSEIDEYKPDYGRTVLCGYARIGGMRWALWRTRKFISRRSRIPAKKERSLVA